MRRLIFFIVGAAIGYASGYLLVNIFAHWYEPRFIKSDDDIGVAYFYSLLFLAVTSIIGGIVSLKCVSKK